MIVAVREFMTIGSGEMSPLLWIPIYIAPVVWFLSDQAVFDVFVQNLKGNFFLFLDFVHIALLCELRASYEETQLSLSLSLTHTHTIHLTKKNLKHRADDSVSVDMSDTRRNIG